MDLIAHEKVYDHLLEMLEDKTLPSALLFTGPVSVGKKKTALMVTENILATKASDFFRHPDFLMIDEEMIKVEDVKKATDFLFERPLVAQRKVLIFNDVHQMNLQSQNKFLKSYEEAPNYSYIILITDKPHKLLDTIVSRARKVPFLPVSQRDIETKLLSEFSEKLAHYGSLYSLGSFSNAYRVLRDEDFKRTVFLSKPLYMDIVTGNTLGIYDKISKIKKGYEETFLTYFLQWLRDLLNVKVKGSNQKVVYQDFLPVLEEESQKISISDLKDFVLQLEKAWERMEAYCNPTTVLLQGALEMTRDLERKKLSNEGV